MDHADEDPQEADQLTGQYANYYQVGHNAFEFVLDFGQYYPENGEAQFGLDHRVGHLVWMTAPDDQRVDTTQGCNQKATSPSLAITHTKAKAGQRRSLWER